MSILDRLPAIASDAREAWERGTIPANLWFEAVMDRYEGVRPVGVARTEPGRIITGDNLRVAKTLFAAASGGTQDAPALIYMDPPFFSKGRYSQEVMIKGADGGEFKLPIHAFSDVWGGAEGGGASKKNAGGEDAFARYLTMLTTRITAAHDMLADDGSLWVHLDHHAAHYVKTLADHIFGGPEHLINEVVWQYSSGGATKRRFSRKHDTLLFYAKDPKQHRFYPMREKSYNRERKPYRFKGVEEYRDDGGWYTLVNMRDVWRIDMVGRTSGERTGYATQKPEALLARIVSSCTVPGDLCVDLFGGSGTLAAVCEKAGRRWITVDESPLASLHAERRMAGLGAAFEILSGTHTVADDILVPASGCSAWEFDVRVERGADAEAASVTVSPASYAFSEDVLRASASQAAKLTKVAREAPERFMAGLSAEALSIGDHGDEPFRPQHVAYGADSLRLPEPCAEGFFLRVRVIDIFGNAVTMKAEMPPGTAPR